MKNKTSGIFATIFFTLISILFVSPIFNRFDELL